MRRGSRTLIGNRHTLSKYKTDVCGCVACECIANGGNSDSSNLTIGAYSFAVEDNLYN